MTKTKKPLKVKGGLLIVESPTKEKTISAILGKEFTVKSCWGHVRDLPRRELGIDIKNGFEPHYVPVASKAKIIRDLKTLVRKSPYVYLATDFDREGEAIAWHLTELIPMDSKNVSRITFHEITPRAIKEALSRPRRIDLDLVHAQQTRRIIDRLVGYSLSPLLWQKLQKGLSAGRVQSVALGFVVERDSEIAAFKPQEYWSLHAKLAAPGAASSPFLSLLVKRGGKKIEKLDLKNKEEVDAILAQLKGQAFTVLEVEEKETSRMSAPPFTTASLQQAAYRAYGFSPARTMRFAQSLYEGKKIGNSTVGLITYMRTDSVSVAPEARDQAADWIRKTLGPKYWAPDAGKRFKAKAKFVQEAHEAIRPSSVYREPAEVAKYVLPEEAKLYELIWTRFVQSQMADQKLAVTTVTIAAGDCVFRASGSVVLFDGFKHIGGKTSSEGEPEPAVQSLPKLSKGQSLDLVEFVPAQHFTEPPPRYNAASLVKAMEAHGVGRPSTYAPTIQTLLNRHYVVQEKKILISTDLGRKVYENLKKHFGSIVDLGFTALMEKNLDLIARKKVSGKGVLDAFWKIFEQDLEKARTNMPVQKIGPQETDEKCEACGSPLLLRESRFGRYLSCKRFPQCKFKIGLTITGEKKVVKKTDIPCAKCATLLVERTGKRGTFLACPNFPKCRFTKTLPKSSESAPEVASQQA